MLRVEASLTGSTAADRIGFCQEFADWDELLKAPMDRLFPLGFRVFHQYELITESGWLVAWGPWVGRLPAGSSRCSDIATARSVAQSHQEVVSMMTLIHEGDEFYTTHWFVDLKPQPLPNNCREKRRRVQFHYRDCAPYYWKIGELWLETDS